MVTWCFRVSQLLLSVRARVDYGQFLQLAFKVRPPFPQPSCSEEACDLIPVTSLIHCPYAHTGPLSKSTSQPPPRGQEMGYILKYKDILAKLPWGQSLKGSPEAKQGVRLLER